MSTPSTDSLPDYYAPKTASANAKLDSPKNVGLQRVEREPYRKPKIYVPPQRNMPPAALDIPVPEALHELVENVIRGVHDISRSRVPTDREMKVLEQAVGLLKTALEVAEGLGKENPFRPLVNAALEEVDKLPSQSQAIERMRAMFGSKK
jgi:hypothetical protein